MEIKKKTSKNEKVSLFRHFSSRHQQNGMYEHLYDYVKLCYMDSDNFIVYVKSEVIKLLKQDLTYQTMKSETTTYE